MVSFETLALEGGGGIRAERSGRYLTTALINYRSEDSIKTDGFFQR